VCICVGLRADNPTKGPLAGWCIHLKAITLLQAASAVHRATAPLQPHVAIRLPSPENRRSAVTHDTNMCDGHNQQTRPILQLELACVLLPAGKQQGRNR